MADGISNATGHSYILISDIQGEKGLGKLLTTMMVDRIISSKTVTIQQGELLGLCKDLSIDDFSFGNSRHHNYYCSRDHSITLYGGENNEFVSPVKSKHLGLLEAITNLADRYAVFCEPAKLDWGANLERGSQVRADISPQGSAQSTWVTGQVMFFGYVESLPGKNFGIEITVNHTLF